MKVEELKDKVKVDEITLKIISKDETKEMNGGALKLCKCVGEDDTGKVNVSLWNDDCDNVEEGNTIKILKGWCQYYQDDLQISSGRFGTLEVIPGDC